MDFNTGLAAMPSREGEPARSSGPKALTTRLATLEALLKETDQRLSDFTAREADRILRRVHERIALSPAHVVTVIAGATGSGKSSLFNALIRYDLAPVGAIRPTTTTGTACVWDARNAGDVQALLDRIGVVEENRVMRGTLLNGTHRRSEPELAPLVLIDLPDHDSAVRAHRDETDRATAAADLLLFVTDPQKYADAAWHERYLTHLSHHQETLVVVLNKSDELAAADARACVGDLRGMLAESGLNRVPVVLTSTRTGEGLHQLRELIATRVRHKPAALLRSEADVDRAATLIAAELTPRDGRNPETLTPEAKSATLLALGDSTSLQAMSDLIDGTYRRRAALVTGWPLRHATRTLISRVRGGAEARYAPWTGAVDSEPEPPPIQHDDVVHAVAESVDQVAEALPPLWAKEMRNIGNRCVKSLSDTLDTTLSGTEVGPRLVPRWWTAVQVLHWMLLTAALVGIGGAVAYAASGGGKDSTLPDTSPIPFPILVALVALAAGALLDLICRPAASRAATRLRARVSERMTDRVHSAAERLLFAPLVAEHERYVRARTLTQGLVRNTGERGVPPSGGGQGQPSI
ncbi:50S ribosome-binding GTPase [Catenulispora sp. NF23]|uniref:GTPase n=1 Tax=Catenulispora pinistramenti TaxID=2705254 RepID=UPI001BAD279C|nr:GTPase [Catenulispora pinistramenti]MBS2538958.1 50S ribosome-binding GTPase [Catenulispora pinistramenti]